MGFNSAFKGLKELNRNARSTEHNIFLCIIDIDINRKLITFILNDFQPHTPSISRTLQSVAQKPNEIKE